MDLILYNWMYFCVQTVILTGLVAIINLIIDNPNSFVKRQNDDIYVVKLNVNVCL
jgi:hypothetical protein